MLVLPSVRYASSIKQAIRFATIGDSRDDPDATSNGPDWYDGALRNVRTSSGTDNIQGPVYYPWECPDLEFTFNCGLSGTELSQWDDPSRPYGRTINALNASDAELVIIGFPTNDVNTGVSSAGTRDSVAARIIGDYQGLIPSVVAAGKKVIFKTPMQRSDSTGAFAYGSNAALKRDCIDLVNATILPWISSNFTSSQVQIADLRAAFNIGGATSGAYLNTAFAPDGCHENQLGGRLEASIVKACVRALFPDRGLVPIYRGVGNNMIPGLSTATCGTTASGTILNNCTISAPDFSLVNGRAAVTYTVTPSDVGFFATQILADPGTQGGRTPAGATFSTGDKLKARMFVTIDDGAGGLAAAPDNFDLIFYTQFSVAGLETVTNGNFNNAPGSFAGGPLINASISTAPRTMPAGSSEIGAPSFGNGMRLMPFVVFQNGPAFRVRYTLPDIRRVV